MEKNLFQTQLHLENEKSNKQSNEEKMMEQLEHETNNRQRLEAEVIIRCFTGILFYFWIVMYDIYISCLVNINKWFS